MKTDEIDALERNCDCCKETISSLPTNAPLNSSGRRIRTPPDEFSGAFVGKELIVFYSDRNIPFQSLNFVRLHGAPELFDQGAAPAPKFA